MAAVPARNYNNSLNPAWTAYVGSGASTGKVENKFIAQVPGVEKHIGYGDRDLNNEMATAILEKEKEEHVVQVALLEEEKKLKAQASPERPPSSSVRGRGRPTSERFVSTARFDAEKCMAARETASKDVKPVSVQIKENKAARQKLAGTQWSFGTASEEEIWRGTIKAGSTMHAGMKEIEAACEVARKDPTIKTFAQQRIENKLAKKKLAGTQWTYGQYVDPDRYKQSNTQMSTVHDPPKEGVGPLKPLTKKEMFEMKQKFKYGNGDTPWADHGRVGGLSSSEKDRQAEIGRALKTVSAEEKKEERLRGKVMKANLTKTQWQYGKEDDLDGRQRSTIMSANDEIMEAIRIDNASPGKMGPAAQRAENLRRRKKLAGTYWSLGTTEDMAEWNNSLSTETKKAYQNHMTVEGLRELEKSIKNGKEAKKRLQTTTIKLGDDPNFY
mmetsp:Transcript_18570/g.43245  ORF Transcript_18570/g.43245 Transcript_18570/m.43245 type:complete len:442 (-) Transcript_18570:56-1381(-)